MYFEYCIIFRFLTSTIPSWFRRYGNQRCYIWRVLATHQTQNLLFNYIPDQVYFPNAKEAEFQYVTVPNLLLSIKPLGQILYMLRSQFSMQATKLCSLSSPTISAPESWHFLTENIVSVKMLVEKKVLVSLWFITYEWRVCLAMCDTHHDDNKILSTKLTWSQKLKNPTSRKLWQDNILNPSPWCHFLGISSHYNRVID